MNKYCKLFLLISFCISILPAFAQAFDKLPDTGQTKCYNNTVEIPCPSKGEAFYGQDASYNINPQSYTKLDASGNDLSDDATSWTMVRDNVTGLIWEVKTDDDSIHDKDNTYTWCDTDLAIIGGHAGTCGDGTDTTDFIDSLNAANYGGNNDWRMPTVKELSSIANRNRAMPCINITFFPKTASSRYWSSTTSTESDGNGYAAWIVHFGDGIVHRWGKLNSCSVRAVRTGQTGSLGNFIDNNDGSVTDTSTGLMWQKITQSQRTWESAIAYCESLPLAGHNDWRLPNINEFQSLIDYSEIYPTIDTSFFPDTVLSYYWSSTTSADGSNLACIVYFRDGNISNINKGSYFYVRAVRTVHPSLPFIPLLLLHQ